MPYRSPVGATLSMLLSSLVIAACATTPQQVTSATESPTTAPSAVTSSPPPATPAPATTTAVTTVPMTLQPTTTTEAPPVSPLGTLVLGDTGIGEARFGDDPESVIDYLGAVLGAPTADTGWTSAAEVLCPGTDHRRVEWGVLRVTFGDSSDFATGRRHFTSWDYGTEGILGEEPQGLITERGIGLGARVDEVLDAYPDTQLFEGEEGNFSASFYINEYLDGFVTGTGSTDLVMVLFGGSRCAE